MGESTRIGLGFCPVCNSPKAHYTLSKKGLVCVTCNGCNFQGFARSERSDEILRAKIKPESPPEAVATSTPVAAAVSEQTTVTEKPTRKSLLSW